MEFKKGYYYFTEDMDRMIYVISVCHCEQCRARGFFEPFTIQYRIGEPPIEDYITVYEKDALISEINKITNDENDEDVQLFFENARTVVLAEVNEIINQQNYKQRRRINMEKVIGKASIELEELDVKHLIIYALKVKYGYEVENISINVGSKLSGFGSMERSEVVFKNAIAILK